MSVSFEKIDPALVSATEVPAHVVRLRKNGASLAQQTLFVEDALRSEMRASVVHQAITGRESPERALAVVKLRALLHLLRVK